MSLWGASTTDESKPKYLSDQEKRDCYATEEGWVKVTRGTGGRAGRVHEEILVAIGELSGGTAGTKKLAAGTISSTRFVTATLGAAAGGAFSAEVIFNEPVVKHIKNLTHVGFARRILNLKLQSLLELNPKVQESLFAFLREV